MTRLTAPAKLTVSLAVTGVRSDGYHELRAEMHSVSLADELTLTEGGTGLSVTAEPGSRAEALRGEPYNLITQALEAVGRTAAVHVTKRIPLGGGLGGGSSDAAAVLRWAGCRDARTAIALGSDVPFSLIGGRALVEGVGERVTPLPFVRREFVLLIPPFGVETRRVYEVWDERHRDGRPGVSGPGATAPPANALTDAALVAESRLVPWRDALGDLTGAEPMLAGSGSTWFVEERACRTGSTEVPGLYVGSAFARLVRVHTVPAGWNAV